ncbi:UNVERIFIED_CONTAM: hypothetical protein Cloal_3219 [Acetivibrio alkalicellulosi]
MQEVQYLRTIFFWDFYLKIKHVYVVVVNFLISGLKNRILYDIIKKANTYLFKDNDIMNRSYNEHQSFQVRKRLLLHYNSIIAEHNNWFLKLSTWNGRRFSSNTTRLVFLEGYIINIKEVSQLTNGLVSCYLNVDFENLSEEKIDLLKTYLIDDIKIFETKFKDLKILDMGL